MVYCVGSIFNTLTILILGLLYILFVFNIKKNEYHICSFKVHIGLFTLPKVYQIYQVQIDQTIQQATAFAHKTADE